jgi:hypothetical protein
MEETYLKTIDEDMENRLFFLFTQVPIVNIDKK